MSFVGLDESIPYLRAHSVRAIGLKKLSKEELFEAINALISILNSDPHPRVRYHAATKLGSLKAEEAK